MMNFDAFQESVQDDDAPAADLSPELKSLWHLKKGEWEASHDIAQDLPSKMGSWIHGLLHAIEGDFGNSAYWYQRAGEPPISKSQIDSEWERITRVAIEG
ncbi:MAG: hypothetical protein P1U86_01170 [Verrucomicrobiales bacterium]|nr:hypothetical protein [Verrucomicrobiales bacterium]